MKIERFGVINIGASAFRMHIAEYSQVGYKVLDYLIKPLRLGLDTFTQGYISLDNVKQATDVLTLFRLKLEEYGVEKHKALCTSGVREAKNKDFFLDYVRINSGISLEILEPTEEIYIKYVGARNTVENFEELEKKGLIFANVSSGNITLNISIENKVLYSGTLPYGSLRLRQMFSSVAYFKRHKAVEEYLRVMIHSITASIGNVNIRNLVGSGSSINLMSRLFKPQDNCITKEQIESVYEEIKTMSINSIVEELQIRQDEASVLVPTLNTYLQLLSFVNAKSFRYSAVSFPETISMYYTGRIKDNQSASRVRNTLYSIADKWGSDMQHIRWVNLLAKKIFDELSELHSLGKAERVVLDAASILNDVGNMMTDENLAGNSYYIVNSLKIPGTEPKTLYMASCVIYEANNPRNPDMKKIYTSLSASERLTVQKLACILRLALSLDAGLKKRIYDIDIVVGRSIIIYAFAEREPYLELYSFDNQKQFFIETFGVAVELRVKIKYD